MNRLNETVLMLAITYVFRKIGIFILNYNSYYPFLAGSSNLVIVGFSRTAAHMLTHAGEKDDRFGVVFVKNYLLQSTS